jgi:hypothetical protein
MDKKLARQMAIAALGCGSSLEKLIPELTAHCMPDERKAYIKGIAFVMGTVHEKILTPLFVSHPDLKEEIEQNVKTRGTFF